MKALTLAFFVTVAITKPSILALDQRCCRLIGRFITGVLDQITRASIPNSRKKATKKVRNYRNDCYHPGFRTFFFFCQCPYCTPPGKESDHGNTEETENISVYYNYAYMYFLPLEKQKELYGYPHAVPTQDEYDQALTIAQKAIEEHYGLETSIDLSTYQTGVIYCIQENVDGILQKQWDFIFTTDPEYLSDGYRVQFGQNVDDNLEDGITNPRVEHANVGNG